MSNDLNQLAPVKPVTTELAKANMNLALTKLSMSVQALQSEVDGIVQNEDGLSQMATVINKAKEIEKAIDKSHEEQKKPYLEAGRAIDKARNELQGLVTVSVQKTKEKYAELCKVVEQRRIEAENKANKDKAILEGINTNIMTFSSQITACKTNKELVAVESKINLEKSRTAKYGEHMPILLEKLNELNALVKTQKTTVQELEQIQKEKAEAENSGDDGKLLNLMDREEMVIQKVQEQKIGIEEKAVSSITSPSNFFAPAREIFPTVKGRKQWKMRLDEPAKALKAGLLNVEINTVKAKLVLASLKEANPEGAEFFKDGICYYQETIF